MIKLINRIYALKRAHHHPCIGELVSIIEGHWFLRWLHKRAK